VLECEREKTGHDYGGRKIIFENVSRKISEGRKLFKSWKNERPLLSALFTLHTFGPLVCCSSE
jgi:hypothetical protein